jgi:hypothetical protein
VAFIFAGIWPKVNSSGVSLLTAGAVPMIGFVFHQIFRCVFEKWFGYDWVQRRVISEIRNQWSDEGLSNKDAFLIWEVTFYGHGFPEGFREHDRGAWHYIVSFWSGAFAAVVAFLIVLPAYGLWALTFIAVGIVLGIKGFLTWVSLCDQEFLIFRRHIDLFTDNKNALRDANYTPKEVQLRRNTEQRH